MAEDDDGGQDGEEDEGGKPGPENSPPAHMLSVHQHQGTQGHHVPAEEDQQVNMILFSSSKSYSTWCCHRTA